jgi:hypothetical protein
VNGLEGVTYALTLWRPWHALMLIGPKDIENRTWPAPEWIIGKKIAIHAGMKLDEPGWVSAQQILAHYHPEFDIYDQKFRALSAVSGALVGTAVVAGCRPKSGLYRCFSPGYDRSPWFFGPWGWQLSMLTTLPVPIPCRGFQKLWTIPKELRSEEAVPT